MSSEIMHRWRELKRELIKYDPGLRGSAGDGDHPMDGLGVTPEDKFHEIEQEVKDIEGSIEFVRARMEELTARKKKVTEQKSKGQLFHDENPAEELVRVDDEYRNLEAKLIDLERHN